MIRCNALHALALFSIVSCAAAIDAPAQSSLEALKSDLRADNIKKVKVLFESYETLTVVALNPEMLENYARHDGTIQMLPFDESMRRSLLAGLEKTRIVKLDYQPDLRWGAIFYDIAGRELHSIYVERRMLSLSHRGIIDGRYVSFNNALLDWFENTFGELTGLRPKK